MDNVNAIGKDVCVEILSYTTFHDRTQLRNTSHQWRRDITIYTKRHYKNLIGNCVVILNPSGAKNYRAIMVEVDVDKDRFKVHYILHGLEKEDIPQNK